MYPQEHREDSDDAAAKAKRMADESFDVLAIGPFPVHHSVVSFGDIGDSDRLTGARHGRDLLFGINLYSMVRAGDSAPISFWL